METLTYQGQLAIRTCWCGIRHAIPEELNRLINQDKKRSAFCPLGHEYVNAGLTTAQQLRDERAENAARERALRDQLDATERSRRALKGVVTKMRNRIAAGVCPVPGCKRTGLTQTMRHIATKHPQWLHDHAEELA